MSAQSEFLAGMEGYRLAWQHEGLVDKAASEREHNMRARSLRNGIAIVGFCVLEHFIRARTGEILNGFDRVTTTFGALPECLRKVATVGAIRGIASRLRVEDDPISFAQIESVVLASSRGMPYQISRFGLGWENANLSADDVTKIMNTFSIDSGWDGINVLAQRTRLTIPSAKDAFRSAAERRHKAAHNIATAVLSSQLEGFVREAYAIALGFDVLMSLAFFQIVQGNTNYLVNGKKVKASDAAVRTIERRGSVWQERREGSQRATKAASTTEALWLNAHARAKTNEEVLVCFDSGGFPCRWAFPALS